MVSRTRLTGSPLAMARRPRSANPIATRSGSPGRARALLAFAAALALLASQAVSALHFLRSCRITCAAFTARSKTACGTDASARCARRRGPKNPPQPAPADAKVDAHETSASSPRSASTPLRYRRQGSIVPVAVGSQIRWRSRVAAQTVKPDRASLLARAPKLSPPALGLSRL